MQACVAALRALRAARVLSVAVLRDPCFGGATASFATACDLCVALRGARVGFAGPAVIRDTCFGGSQRRFDAALPRGF